MGKRRGCFHSVMILLVVAIIAAGFWYFENETIKTEELTVRSSRLPAGFDGYRIVQISDLHAKVFGEDQQTLLQAVEDAKPDLIAITGDLINQLTDLSAVEPLLADLPGIAPTYYVTGNHEWDMAGGNAKLFARLEQCGIRALRNESLILESNGQSIVLAGVDDPNGPYDQKTPQQVVDEVRQTYGDAYVLMLAHRNGQMDLWKELSVDTVLVGHGHGGIIRLPYFGGILGVDREFFPDYTAGVYEEDTTTMVVSRGLGDSGVKFRLFNRPHLPVIVLRQ